MRRDYAFNVFHEDSGAFGEKKSVRQERIGYVSNMAEKMDRCSVQLFSCKQKKSLVSSS